MRHGLALLLTCSTAFGCQAEATSLWVEVVDGSGGALEVPLELDAFEIRVSSIGVGEEDLVRFRRTFRLAAEGIEDGVEGEEGYALPQTLAIVPDDVLSSGTVRVDVYALRGGLVRQTITRIQAFGTGQQRFPPFAITPLCFGVDCPPGQSCNVRGECRASPVCGDDDRCTGPDIGPCGLDGVSCGDACFASDNSNCGACGAACAPAERCIANVCGCPAGSTRCDGRCVDTLAAPNHCGLCDIVCDAETSTSSCADGSCEITSCTPDRGDCNAIADDGCEVDLTNAAAHCGSCGNTCGFPNAASSCAGSSCQLGPCAPGFADCNRIASDGCETPLNTNLDCDSCGRSCASGTACAGGQCLCGGVRTCSPTEYCFAGTCAPRPVIRVDVDGNTTSSCADSGATYTPPSFRWRVTVTGRPNADAMVYQSPINCPGPPVHPVGTPNVLDAAGRGVSTESGAPHACNWSLLGRIRAWAVVDGVESNRVTKTFFNSGCPPSTGPGYPDVLTCGAASTVCGDDVLGF